VRPTNLIAVAATFLSITAVEAKAAEAEQLGSALAMECENTPHTAPLDYVSCVSYLRGVWDGIIETQERTGKGVLCTKRPVTSDQLRRIYLKWANSHPSLLSHSAGYTAVIAFTAAYPCPTARGNTG
jgi:hypothetical protein